MAFEHAKELASRGYPSWVMAPRGSPLALKCAQTAMALFEVEPRSYFSPQTSFQLRRLLKQHKINTVILQQLKDIWLVSPALIGLSPVELLGFGHTFLSHSKKDLAHSLLYKRLDKLAALTPLHAQNLLQNLPLNKEKIEIIPNWVNTEIFHPKQRSDELRAQWGASQTTPLIALVGRLDAQKGQIETLQAASLLKKKGFSFQLLFVGEETVNSKGTKTKMLAQIKELGLQNEVKLTGFIQNPAALMASLDLFLMPSYFETFGKVLIEAMASQVACISTRAGGVLDIINEGQNGLLVAPRDAVALSTAMETLLGNPLERDRLALAARQTAVEAYSQDKIAAKLDHFWGLLTNA